MSAIIVRSSGPICLIGAGSVDSKDLAIVAKYGRRIVAVDGGANHALAAGLSPDAVIGDLDSLSEAARAEMPVDRVHAFDEQMTTDFDKALRSVDAPLIIGVGFMGPRLDHTLATFATMVRYPDKNVILVGVDEIACHLSGGLSFRPTVGVRLSLFPFLPVTGTSRGLEWPIDGLKFSPDEMIGTSNRVTGPVELAMDGPGMMLLMPRSDLDALIEAFAD